MKKVYYTCLLILWLSIRGFGEVTVSTNPACSAERVTIILTGDIQPGITGKSSDWFDRLIAKKGADYLFENATGYLSAADIIIGNFEGVLTDSNTRARKKHTFKNSPAFAAALKKAGFSVLTIANNHSLDYGVRGLKDTLQALSKNGIYTVGAGSDENEAYKPVFITTHNVTKECSVSEALLPAILLHATGRGLHGQAALLSARR
jgi:poly-gamma-glutamate synthesis protein (capsule biosynthesis protein)